MSRWGGGLALIGMIGGGALLVACGPSTVDDEPTCYSPTQNVEHAYDAGAKGCACDGEKDADVCVEGSTALVCDNGRWLAVEDGPCEPPAHMTYSPASCQAAGGVAVASPGGPLTPEHDCESGVALGIIDFASSGWDEGGLCCAVGKDPVPTEVACGARAGDTCSATEYCAYQEGQYCGGADAESVCKPRPESCIELYAPVCGCDQKTYDNSCFANAAGTGILSAGACKPIAVDEDPDCFSPTQNVAHAYDDGAHGCACDPKTDVGVCLEDAALICDGGVWHAVLDGPCGLDDE